MNQWQFWALWFWISAAGHWAAGDKLWGAIFGITAVAIVSIGAARQKLFRD